MAFARIADAPIRVRSQIYEPDYVIIVDATLMRGFNCFSGLKEDCLRGVPLDDLFESPVVFHLIILEVRGYRRKSYPDHRIQDPLVHLPENPGDPLLQKIAGFLERGLGEEGHRVDVARDLAQARLGEIAHRRGDAVRFLPYSELLS